MRDSRPGREVPARVSFRGRLRGEVEELAVGDLHQPEQALRRPRRRPASPQAGQLQQVERLDRVDPAQRRESGHDDAGAAVGRLDRRLPGDPVGFQVAQGDLPAVAPHGVDEAVRPVAGVHHARAPLGHPPQRRGQLRLAEPVAATVKRAIPPGEDPLRLRQAAQHALAIRDPPREQRIDLEPVLGQRDRRLDDPGHRQLAEPVARRLHARHEPRHQRGPSAGRPGPGHRVHRGDRERVGLLDRRVVPGVQEVILLRPAS